jgi:ribonuclease HIII
MPDPSSFTFKISVAQAEKLRGILEAQNFTFREVPYTVFGAQKDKLTVNAYTSGKLLVQGRGAKEFVEFTIEPEITGEAKVGYDEIHHPEMFQPHLGIDESGKGDFFGPLVIAGVYVDGDLPRRLIDLGVRDSKLIGSDQKALDLADAIKEMITLDRFNVIAIGPAKYNDLYVKFRNLNSLLAWGHAMVIENLLTRWPTCPRALSDKFAHESLIRRALKERGKQIILDQRTKAESDVAVAAASILARAEFLRKLKALGDRLGVPLPKGASALVKATAKGIFEKHGREQLKSVSKFHFKTFREVTGEALPGEDTAPPEFD